MDKITLRNLPDLLNKYFGCAVQIIDQKIGILTGPGEHYGSVILRVDLDAKIKGEQQSLNLVAKLIPLSELLQKAFDVQVTFRKESFAYSETLPTLIAFQKEFNCPEEKLLNFFPKFYGSRYNLEGTENNVDQNAVLLFENLKSAGFETIDRLQGFDFKGAKVVIKDLAKFHAVPLALRLLRPATFDEKVRPGLVHHKGAEALGEEVVSVFHNAVMNTAKQIDELQPYLLKIQKIVDHFAINPYTIRPEPSQEFGTISHCDLWTSNLMVLKDLNGEVTECKYLDMQLTNYSSPIRDLIFFMFTSIQNDVLKENVDNFIKLYYDEFVDILRLFNIDLTLYSWDKFNEELQKVAPDEVYHVLFMLKIICSQRGKVTNTIDNFEITDWTRSDLLGEDHKRKMRDTVLMLVAKNWL